MLKLKHVIPNDHIGSYVFIVCSRRELEDANIIPITSKSSAQFINSSNAIVNTNHYLH